MKKAGFIGGGRITRILLNGLRNAGIKFSQISVFDTDNSTLEYLNADYPQIEISCTDINQAASSDWVFVALHPPVVLETLSSIKNFLKKDALIISLAPKITISKLKTVLPGYVQIARMNPNAATFINKGYNPVCFAESNNIGSNEELLGVFKMLGNVPVVDEKLIEAYAVISAMGHTYFWYQLQQLAELGISYGMSETDVKETITCMIDGTIQTLFNSGLSYEQVVDLVPVKPMSDYENTIKEYYRNNLNTIYQKIKPAL
jgi:pyrroline-5-carboxylate reductase